ncbi:hypothetical protein scyTo_0025403, partial [Scyliorhinus torazame]|nr:hypothetical protein [Scyliorhinus torazame]
MQKKREGARFDENEKRESFKGKWRKSHWKKEKERDFQLCTQAAVTEKSEQTAEE